MSESRSTARRLHEITRLHSETRNPTCCKRKRTNDGSGRARCAAAGSRSIRDEADCKKCIYWTLTVKFPPNLRETSQPVEIGVHVSFSLSFTAISPIRESIHRDQSKRRNESNDSAILIFTAKKPPRTAICNHFFKHTDARRSSPRTYPHTATRIPSRNPAHLSVHTTHTRSASVFDITHHPHARHQHARY